MSTRIIGGPRDGHIFEATLTAALLWCAQPGDTDATMKHRRIESDPDGTAVYRFVEAKHRDGRALSQVELDAIPEPRWIPVEFS